MLALALCVAVMVTAYACVVFPRDQGRIAPIWLANAWTVAALLRTPTRRWWLLALAAVGGNVAANLLAGDPATVAAGLAGCNILEGLACAWLVRRRCGDAFDIGRIDHLAAFVGSALAASALSAGAAASLLGFVDHANVARGLAVWAIADVLGLLTLAPSLLVLSQKSRTPFVWREAWTLAVLAAVAVLVLFFTHYPLLFVISAVLMLPTWRMGLPGAVAGVAILALLGAVAVLTGHGPVMVAATSDRMIGLQVFLIVCFLSSVPVAVARDAGERLRGRLRGALAEARAARAEAETAAAVKGEFLANMSHELRTPLTSVVGFTRLAAEQTDLSPLSRTYIDRVGEASRALLCAVNDILDFSKLEAGQVSLRPEPVALHGLLSGTLELFMPQAAAKDLTLRLLDTTPHGLVVAADPDRLRQVLLNLVGNAVKFTTVGEVTLCADYDEDAGRLMLEIVDTGPGISPDHIGRLFQRFSQVDGGLNRNHGGTGLGLAICKGIVEAMGGDISAASIIGEGSCFSVIIPAPRAEGAEAAPSGEGVAITRPGVRVLVADDHAANRELVRLFLAGIGAEVIEAADGEAAVELAAGHPFDVILMDLRMPGLDGVGALARIRAQDGPNLATPVLAFTADAESASDNRLQAVGFDGVVAKPVDPGQLIAEVLGARRLPDDDEARASA